MILDLQLTLDNNVTSVSKARALLSHNRAPYHMRRSPPHGVAKMAASSIVDSRLDNCNLLYARMSEANCQFAASSEETVACIVTGHERRDHITPVLVDHHCLPIKSRVTFKIVPLTYSMRKSRQPTYLRTSIPEYKPTHALRSSSQNVIAMKCSKKDSTDSEQPTTDSGTL